MDTIDLAAADRLLTLREQLDGLDDALHDLLIQRSELVEQVGTSKARAGAIGRLRPGREAAILRRLLARHHGALPPTTILRIWRELLAGSVSIQGSFAIAVCDPDPQRGTIQVAREHFGALTPLRVHRSPLHAIGEVSAGIASAAILPLPSAEEPRAAAWWLALLHTDTPRIHVVARLPFWTARPEGAAAAQALVVASMPPDPSGDDTSLIGLELPGNVSQARLTAALAQAGFTPGAIILRREDAIAFALAEVAGCVSDTDPRLADLGAVSHPPVVLGVYANPIGASPGAAAP